MSSDLTKTCTDLQPQIAAYALGEIEADAELLDHMAVCPTCQRDLRAYVQVARMLPYEAPDAAPPAELRERILAVVEATVATPEGPAPDLGPPEQAKASRPLDPPRQQRWLAGWLRPSLRLALAVVVVALLGWNIALQRQLSGQAAQLSASREGWQTMIVLLNDPAVHSYPVSGETASGRFWMVPQGQAACLVVQGLPPIAEDRAYQVWLTRSGKRISGGVFQAHDGNAWILIRSDEPLTDFDLVGVTVEPREGSPAPTGPRVLQGAITPVRAAVPLLPGRAS